MSKGRHLIIAGIVLSILLVVCSPSAFALDPRLDVAQYAHTAWRIADGFAKGRINAIAQTVDGYLWLGTNDGLIRFDGVKATPWEPPSNHALPSAMITALLGARDGTLWIGTDRGVVSWRDGRLTQLTRPDGPYRSGRLLEDRSGTIWGVVYLPRTNSFVLCTFQRDRAECHGEDGGPGAGGVGLYEDSKGNLWVGTLNGLWRWKPAPARFYPLGDENNGFQGLAEDESGTLLIARRGRVERFVDGRLEMRYPFPPAVGELQFFKALSDREGSLWLAGTAGLLHVHQGAIDAFGQSDGLSSDFAAQIFEDREGNVWVATSEGLDRFRDVAITNVSTRQGLLNPGVSGLLASPDGSVWIGTFGGLNKAAGDGVTVYRARAGSIGQQAQSRESRKSRFVNGVTLPAGGVYAIHQDRSGRIWLSTESGVGYLDHDRVTMISGVPPGVTRSITEDGDGNIWIANQTEALFRISGGRSVTERIPWTAFGRQEFVSAVVGDPLKGGVWVGFAQGGLSYFAEGHVQASYAASGVLAAGRVSALFFDRERALWIAAERGLSRLKNGRLATLTAANGLPCESVQWAIEDDAGALWLAMPCGLVRIPEAARQSWTAAADRGQSTNERLQLNVFGSEDGFRSAPGASYYSAPVVKATDGRLWFMSPSGVGVLDPARLPSNGVPPPVHIERLTADRNAHDTSSTGTEGVRLPPLVRDLQIDYTALSLVAPERMRFRYKLEGWDRDWQDVGNRHQAYYNNLGPGSYRFRVIASNNSGVWNETGATLDFAIAPAYYQTGWFRAFIVIALVSLVVAAYRLRLRQVASYYNARLDARVAERTRIARELHDTLLQSFQGVLLKFHAATYLLPDRPEEAKKTLEGVIDQARNAITEGRDAVQGLRAAATLTNDLPGVVRTFAEDLAASHESTDVQLHVEGMPRDLAPLVQDDVYRIACEAMRNAFKHSDARHVEVEIHYDQRQFRLRIRDDGKGIEPNILRAGGRPRHYGLKGMHERAAVVGGKLTVWSEVDAGTEIELTVPASVAYAGEAASRPSFVPEQT